MRPAVFLDRDGVLNEIVERDGQPGSPRALDEFRLVADAGTVVARFRQARLPVLVVTNQPDIARGLLPQADLDGMLAQLHDAVGVDDAAVCPHQDSDGCACRKPLPGLLLELAHRWEVDLTRSFMVGDSWRDMEAGRAAGCRTVLLRRWYNEDATADVTVATLADAADWILNETG